MVVTLATVSPEVRVRIPSPRRSFHESLEGRILCCPMRELKRTETALGNPDAGVECLPRQTHPVDACVKNGQVLASKTRALWAYSEGALRLPVLEVVEVSL